MIFRWRVHGSQQGHYRNFNRSHYEDVLIRPVHKLVPKSVWSERYASINDFERLLADSDGKILKFFLHQQGRAEETTWNSGSPIPKRMEGELGDFEEASLGPVHERVRGPALSSSAEWAPWYIIPANQKWFVNSPFPRSSSKRWRVWI